MKKLSFLFAALAAGVASVSFGATTSVPKPDGLTDLTSPKGAVVSGTDLMNGMSPQLAFNDATSLSDNNNRCILQSKKLDLVYTFDEATAVNALGIQNFNNGDCVARSPKTWTFWGSNDFDGTRAGIATAAWEKLDERSDETGWAKPEYRYYQFGNVKKFKSYKISFTDNNGNTYLQFQKLEYFYLAQTGVQISGVPAECGDFSYDTIKPEVGTTVNLSAFDGTWVDAKGTTSAVCTGYDVLVKNGETGKMELLTSGLTTSCSFTMPDALVQVVWKFDRSFKVTATSAGNGSVSGLKDWYKEGGACAPILTPDTGYGFFKWETDDPAACKFDKTFLVKRPTALSAIFASVVALEPGECVLSDAVKDADDGNLILRLAAGTYTETNSESCVTVNKPIRIEGVGEGAADVTVKRAGSQSARIFYLDHPDAVLKNLTISGGYGKTNVQPVEGGNVYITQNGGTVMDSIITGGNVNTYNSCGGNVRMRGGHILRCIVKNGYTSTGYGASGGGGINTDISALIENCLITGNTVGGTAGCPAGVRLRGASRMVNCTIVANGDAKATAAVGGVQAESGTEVINCAIFDNIAKDDGTDHNQTWGGEPAAFVNCYADVLINGTCFQTANPAFTDAPNGDYTLSVSSPLRDKGADYLKTGACSATDLVGGARIGGSGVDVGAYEYISSGLSVDFTADKQGGLTPCVVTFTATVEGATGNVSYNWDFDGDGVANETTTTPTVTHTYEQGNVYTVGLVVTDDGSGKTAEAKHADMIKTCQKTLYVATDGANEFPYANRASAATTIAAAVEAAVDGCEILIASGDYSHKTQISVTKALRIVGLGDSPTNVYVHGTSDRAFYVDNASALIANLEMKGALAGNGRTIIISNSGGTVSNCVIHVGGGNASAYSGGGAINGTKAFVTHCTLVGNGLSGLGDGWMRGGVVHFNSKSRIENSLIQGCAITYDLGNSGSGGSTLSLNGGSVAVNCTIVNCTNSTESSVGIFLSNDSFATNCAVYDVRNTTGSGYSTWYGGALANLVNCSDADLTAAAFKDYANGDYTPVAGGALYNAGVTPEGWENLTDLAGGPRVVGKAIDIGCYEGKAAGMLLIVR